MKSPNKITLTTFSLILIFSLSTCKKDKEPDGFTADFTFTFAHGGMAPDTAKFSAQYPEADSYNWDISGISGSDTNFQVLFNAAGDFDASLTVKSGSFSDNKSASVPINNFPPGGTAMTIIQGNGEVGTVVLDAENPRWLAIDTIDANSIGGMDYDDENKTLYYTSSIKRSFPNGVGKEVIFDDSQLNPWEDGIVDLVVDGKDQLVYFVIHDSYGISAISTLSLDMFTRSDIGFFQQSFIQFITLDKASDKYYFTAESSTEIHFGDAMGVSGSTNGNDALNYAIVFDNYTNVLYYVNDGDFDEDYDIMRVYPDNDYYEEMVVDGASLQPILGLDIDENKQYLYWTDQAEDVIYRLKMNETGAEPEVIFENVTNPKALAIGNFPE